LNTTEYAKRIGVKQPLVSKWIRQGVLKKSVKKIKGRYQINAKMADKERRQNLDPIRGGRRTKKKKKPTQQEKEKTVAQAKTAGIDFNEARRLNEQYKAALKKIQYEKETGKLIELSKVEKTAFEAGRQVKEGCLAIADRCAPLVAVTSDPNECKNILNREITYILENLAAALEKIN